MKGNSNTLKVTMRGILLIIIVGSCSGSIVGPLETLRMFDSKEFSSRESNENPELMELGRMITVAMQSLLAHHERSMDARLKQLELYVDHTCRSNLEAMQAQRIPEEDFEVRISQQMQMFMDHMLSVIQASADELQHQFDSKIEAAMMKMDEELSEMATFSKHPRSEDDALSVDTSRSSPLSDVNEETLSVLSEMIEGHLRNLATRTDLLRQTKHQDELIFNILKALDHDPSKEVLNYTKNIHDVLYSFKPIYDDFRNVTKNCNIQKDQFRQLQRFEQLLQDLKKEVDDNGNEIADMFSAIEGAEDLLNEKLITPPESRTDHIQSDGSHLSTTSAPTASPSKEDSPSDCKDSDFLAVKRSVDVCKAAVRFGKCHMRLISYHCCHTCTEAGALPTVGSHRYLAYPRKVNLKLN